MEEMWLARDRDNSLYMYAGKPYKHKFTWNSRRGDIMSLDSNSYPEIQWEDEEPTKVKLIIEK